MESKTPAPNPEVYFGQAAALLAESSNSIANQCCKEIHDTHTVILDLGAIIYELTAFLGSILLHEAHSKHGQGSASDIHQTYQSLKDSLTKLATKEPSLSTYSLLFDDQQFHQLLACYFNGKLEGFKFTPEDIKETSTRSGLEAPTNAGIETIFFALLTRLFQVTDVTEIKDSDEAENATKQLTRLAETGIAAFAIQLQGLGS